jgi:hypothetical protein
MGPGHVVKALSASQRLIHCALERGIHKHFDSVRKYGRKKSFFLITREEIGYHFHVRSLQVQRGATLQTKDQKKKRHTANN